MALTIKKEIVPRDESLVEAVGIMTSPVFPAMSIANALGGYPSETWDLIRGHKLEDILAECDERKLDLSQLKASCSDDLAADAKPYQEARRRMQAP